MVGTCPRRCLGSAPQHPHGHASPISHCQLLEDAATAQLRRRAWLHLPTPQAAVATHHEAEAVGPQGEESEDRLHRRVAARRAATAGRVQVEGQAHLREANVLGGQVAPVCVAEQWQTEVLRLVGGVVGRAGGTAGHDSEG